MPPQIHARPARPEDKAPILAFCQNTFSWGDYISEAWDAWLADTTSCLIVGEADAQPVGILHVKPIEGGVMWMEGMRVHPEFRRQGVALTMDRVGCAWAREHGGRLARLATSRKNTVAQHAIEFLGYHVIARFNEWNADALPGECAHIAAASDANLLLMAWRDFAPRVAGNVLLPNRDWRWTYLTRARVQAALDAYQVRAVKSGWMFLHDEQGDDWRALIVHAFIGDAHALRQLALAARAEADHRDYRRVEIIVADHPLLNGVLQDAGYLCETGMLIYEKIL
ncbi:MAG: GNAT family N-acetyltransferase [Chloroflexi bacterium]|nr:GNAT family N-acetyltransferase [Chloroflexota bacterium]